MLIGHRVRLAPTLEQESLMRQACGVARFAYNWALAQWREQYQAGGQPSEIALRKQLNAIKAEHFPWMALVTKNARQQGIKNLVSGVRQLLFRPHEIQAQATPLESGAQAAIQEERPRRWLPRGPGHVCIDG
jgi:Helix-turn-helix domain